MLMGKAVVAIWNGIAPEGRAEFYDWHVHEHIPERVDIPGFSRGRRYIAADDAARPEFLTLYEAEDFDVLRGPAYAARLEAPTPWTRTATSRFRNTARALAHVVSSAGRGSGGVLLSLRFDADPDHRESLAALVAGCLDRPRVCAAHLCVADDASSRERTAESRDRTDIEAPPTWFALVEATDVAALDEVLPEAALAGAGGRGPVHRGLYRLEFLL